LVIQFPADRLGKSWCWRCAIRALTANADMLGTGF
jgi:hypothetical protein